MSETLDVPRRRRRGARFDRAVVDQLPDGVVVCASDLTIESVNRAAARMFGWDADELAGRSVEVLVAEGRAAAPLAAVRRYAEGGPAPLPGSTVEVVGRRRDGTSFPMTLSLGEVRLGRRRAFAAVVREVPAREAAAADGGGGGAPLGAAAQLSILIEHLHAGVVLETEPRRVALVNRRFREMFGPRDGAPAAASPADAHAATGFRDPAAALGRIESILARREPVHSEQVDLADGRVLERDYIPLWSDGRYSGHFWLYRDVTDRRRAEAAVHAAREAAERANRSKSEFLAGISHEIRTPMTAIVGYSGMLREQLPESERQYAAQQIRRNSEHLLALLNDVLDLSRIEAGRLRVDVEPISVTALLSGVVPLARTMAEEKGVQFVAAFPGPLPASVRTDPVRLRQILLNLLGNAVKFTDSGRVAVTTRFVPPPAPGACGRLLFEVEDTGIGIGAEQLARLFHPFEQVHDARSRREGGTGLGLAITKRLVDALGGVVAVVSAPGSGSRFTVDLPVARDDCARLDLHPELPTAAGVSATGGVRPRLDGRRILVVDDNRDNQRIVRFYLEDAGAAVATADDGRAGVYAVHEAAQEGRPYDVVLMDMQMPVRDGFQATQMLRGQGVTTPIVALTAFAMTGDAARCLAAGCDGYVAKPIVPEDLFAALQRFLGRRPPAAPPVPARKSGPSDYVALVRDYVLHLAPRAAEIRAARDAGDAHALRTLAHRLRGTGATLGFPGITARAGAVEDALRGGAAVPDVAPAIDALLEVMETASPP